MEPQYEWTLVVFHLFLFSPLQIVDLNSTCFQGFTGNNTGGSCFFDNTFCNWNNTNVGRGWSHKTNNVAGIVFHTKEKYAEEKAQLISPLMCEDPETDLCIQLQYKFYKAKDLFLFVKLQNETRFEQLVETLNTSMESSWLVSNITLKSPGKFYIVIEAKQAIGAVISDEPDIEIKSIVYRNTSCNVNIIDTTMDTVYVSTQSLTVQNSTTNMSPGHDAMKRINVGGVALGVAILVLGATIFIIVFVLYRKTRRVVHKDLNQEGQQQETMIKNELYCAT